MADEKLLTPGKGIGAVALGALGFGLSSMFGGGTLFGMLAAALGTIAGYYVGGRFESASSSAAAPPVTPAPPLSSVNEELQKIQAAQEEERRRQVEAMEAGLKRAVEEKAVEEAAQLRLKLEAEKKAFEERQTPAAQKPTEDKKLKPLSSGLRWFPRTQEGDDILEVSLRRSRVEHHHYGVETALLEELKRQFKDVQGAVIKEVNENGYRYALLVDRESYKDTWYIKEVYSSYGPGPQAQAGFINKGSNAADWYYWADQTRWHTPPTQFVAELQDTRKRHEENERKREKERKKEPRWHTIPLMPEEKALVGKLTAQCKGWRGLRFGKTDDGICPYALFLTKPAGGDEIWDLKFHHDSSSYAAYFVNREDQRMSFEATKGIDYTLPQKLQQIRRDAARNAESEKADAAGIRNFDLPKDRPIGYLAFDGMGGSEAPEFNSIDLMRAFPEVLTRCGYDMVCPAGAPVVTPLEANPATTVYQRVKQMHDLGVRDFYLNFAAHGLEDGMWPQWQGGKSHLSSEDLGRLVMQFSDCNFVIHTDSCHGGGAIKMMRGLYDFPGAKEGRVTVFTDTKEDKLSWHGTQNLMAKFMADKANNIKDAPATYGEAFLKADDYSKRRRTPQGVADPEAWRSTPGRKSRRTAQNVDKPDSPDSLRRAAKQYFAGHIPAVPGNPVQDHGLPGELRGDAKGLT